MKTGKHVCSATVLEFVLIVTTLVLGLVHTWAGRYSMNPDGISYLDLGDAFAKHDWAHAFNAWWSPGYPWILGIVVNLIGPSLRFEFPLVHVVNFLIFIATLTAFRFCLHEAIRFCNEGSASEPRTFPLSRRSLVLLGYAIFLWTSLEVVSIYGVGPDLLVMLFVCLIGGMLLGLRRDPSLWRFLLFGLILGVGYWFKTILLPLGIFSLLCVYVWKPASGGRDRGSGIRIASCICSFGFVAIERERTIHDRRYRNAELCALGLPAHALDKLAGRDPGRRQAASPYASYPDVPGRI